VARSVVVAAAGAQPWINPRGFPRVGRGGAGPYDVCLHPVAASRHDLNSLFSSALRAQAAKLLLRRSCSIFRRVQVQLALPVYRKGKMDGASFVSYPFLLLPLSSSFKIGASDCSNRRP
jgi:hypothetical protein